MNQLRLISIEHLKQTSKPLGKGAFGIVYAVSFNIFEKCVFCQSLES